MLNRKRHSKPAYTESQATHWLSWLARGMQQHGQTIFLIENLQPSWLPERRQRRLYVFCSGLLDGLLFGLILAIVSGLTVGLSAAAPSGDLGAGLEDGFHASLLGGMAGIFFGIFKGLLDWSWLDEKRLWQGVKKLGARWQVTINVILTGLIIAMAYAVNLFVFVFIERLAQGADFFAATDYRFFIEWWHTELTFAGLIVGAGAILLWGTRAFHQSLAHDIRTVESLGWSWASAFKGAISMLRFGLIAIAILAIGYLWINWDQHPQYAWKEDLLDVLAPGLFAGLAFALVCAFIREVIRRKRRGVQKDGRPALSRWSWKRIMQSAVAIFPAVMYVILIALLPMIDRAIPYIGPVWDAFATNEAEFLSILLFTGLVLALMRSVFAGLKKGVVEMKVRPNEGIRLSVRSALLGGGCIGGVLGAGAFLLAAAYLVMGEFLSDVDEGLIVSIAFGVFVAVISGLFASLWYGGQDSLRHYILRYLLYRNNYTPRHFARFLDYAANELNFLQKVGGGYIFIHRYLLEHFAGITKPQETPK
ncbi:MAG: hypothetical protein ACE5I1_00440 [bacterium]